MDWTAFRQHFLITSRWAFFDHAAVCPIPDVAVAAFKEYADRIASNGLADVQFWASRMQHVRQLAATFLNAPSVDDVCFIPNTTTGIGLIAEGYPWQPGDEVVLAAEEYPSNQYPWLNLESRGVLVKRVASRGNRILLDDFRAAISSRTRVLAVSMVQFSSGFRVDLANLRQLCDDYDLFFFVDAIQGLGAFPLDVQHYQIDACAADSHKWMLGPEGAGIAYINQRWIEHLRPINIGAHSVIHPFEYTTIDLQLKPNATRYEGGALNSPGLSAMGASIELMLKTGTHLIAERILQLTDYLCDQSPRVGLEVFSCREEPHKSGIVSLVKPNVDPRDIQRKARESGVIVNVRAGRLRVSPHAYNTEAEIDHFLSVVSEFP